MNSQFKMLCAAAVAGLAAILPAGAWGDAVLHARVAYDAGGSMVRGVEDSDWAHATVNTLILPGDTLWVDQGGTSELEFSGGSFLRMADGSKAEISTVSPSPTVRGWEGSFYVHRLNRSTGEFIFVSPAATVQVEPDSAVRVDIVNEATTITVRWGKASVRTDVGSPTYVSGGERVWVDPGLLPSNPAPFDRSEEDGFDVWNRERVELLTSGYSNVPESAITEPVMGVSDLGTYGEWVNVDNTRYWRPTVVSNYVPYRYGSWSYTPAIGYSWVDHYPFSYVTTHYGRWRYMPTYGWCWAYDPVWSPAWVATVRCGDYLVWSPIDYYYRPAYTTSSAFFNIGGVSFGMFSSSYCPVSYVGLGPRYVYGVNSDVTNYIYNHGSDVYIWNINFNDSAPHVRVPYDRPLDQVRIYNPRRSIRGPQALGGESILASQRVSRLEGTIGRTAFSASSRTGREGVRTDATSPDRAARVRSVRVSQEAPSYTRASARNPEDAVLSANRTERVPRSRDIGAGEDIGGRRGLRGDTTSPERGAAAREATEARTPVERGTRESGSARPVDAGDRTPAGTANRAPRGERGETAPDRTPADGTGRGIRPGMIDRGNDTLTTRTPTPGNVRGNLNAPAVRLSPGASRTQVERGSSEVTRTPVRSGPPAITTPDRERVTTPTVRGNSGASSTRVERTPSRSGPPPATAPDRSLSTSQQNRPRVITTTPGRSSTVRGNGSSATVERTRPVDVPVTRQPSRSPDRTSVRQSAPQVDVPSPSYRNSQPAPSRSYSTPQFTRPSAPAPSREPSRSITRSEPSVRQPQPAPAPRIERSAPAPEISRPTPRMPEVSRPAEPSRRPDDGGASRGGGEGRSVRGR